MVGRPAQEWSFGYSDLTRITGLDKDTIVQHRVRGAFDPEKMETVVLYLLRHAKADIREDLAMALIRRASEDKVGTIKPGKQNLGKAKRKKKA